MAVFAEYMERVNQNYYHSRLMAFLERSGEVSKTQLTRGCPASGKMSVINGILVELEAMGVISARIDRTTKRPTLRIKLTSDKSLIEYAKNHFHNKTLHNAK